ncbi:MAG: YggU family protein [Proteobacteria bacterium]|nr:YggU family protein [Pseudomonadota bacterium]
MLQIRETKEGLVFKIVVLPKSSKNMIAGLHDDAIKLKITAPPVDGSANKMCISFLSKILKTPKSSLEIVSGASARIKQILWRKDTTRDTSTQKQTINDLIK